MKRIREYLPIAACGATLWWLAEHAFDKGIEQIIGAVMQLIGHLSI